MKPVEPKSSENETPPVGQRPMDHDAIRKARENVVKDAEKRVQ